MTYSITYGGETPRTTVTIRKGAYCVRSTSNPALVGAYASLYALHGDKVLPHLWDDIAGHPPARCAVLPCTNADAIRSVPYVPTGCSYSVPAQGPTMQRRAHPVHLRAHGVETAYRSRDYYVK